MRVARVIVDVRTRQLDRSFDYLVPDGLSGRALAGAPVVVPFGSRFAGGIIVALTDQSAYPDLKPIRDVVGEPLCASYAHEIAEWMAAEYVCGAADALRPFLPPGGAPRVIPDGDGYSLEARGAHAVTERWVSAAPGADPAVIARNATRQRSVFDGVSAGPVRMAELRAELGDVSAAVKALEARGLVDVEEHRRFRRATVAERPAPRHARLTTGQQAALDAIAGARPGATVLLDGVTGSGKTEVYLRAIEDVLASGGSAIVLVPEIALTPQTVGRFRARFGDAVAVLHSRLSAGERLDQWELARRGDVSLVVGPRSALFAPIPNLAMVVIDEEHEGSYKQGSAPRYHARDVARRICAATGALLVLGSATPSLETRTEADRGTVHRVRMSERATGARLPTVDIVDMGAEFANGNRSVFSRALAEALAGVEARGEKAVLFLNRRGFAAFLLCRECGYVPTCDSCTVSMTYHEVGSRLACHHCSAVRAVPEACPACGSPYLRQFGAGTQRIEADLSSAFPSLPVVRMDADTTARKGGHEARLAEFEAADSAVLLGTQMIAKGLDYPDVTLVGVLSADLGLRLPDFRAGERTYQLLEQVAGRAGRGERPGSVVIQSYWPDHPAVVAAAAHDPDSFYAAEARDREALGYPPFGRLARVLAMGRKESEVRETVQTIASAVESAGHESLHVVGPSPAPIARARGTHRWHVLVKGPAGADLPAAIRAALDASTWPETVNVAPDIDPMDLL